MDVVKGRGVKEVGLASTSLGRFQGMAWVGGLSGGEPGSSSSMMMNFGEADGLLFEVETMGVRFVAKGSVVC